MGSNHSGIFHGQSAPKGGRRVSEERIQAQILGLMGQPFATGFSKSAISVTIIGISLERRGSFIPCAFSSRFPLDSTLA